MSPDYYITIEKSSTAEYKEKGSRFIAFAFPINSVEDFKERMRELKKEHPKATHHCFAYRLGPDRTVFRVSDDGEPSGTAGKPILGKIDSKKLTDVLIVVVRYFGGTQLGVPGLINAYKNSAALVLQLTPSVQMPVLCRYRLHFDYTLMNEIMLISKQSECRVSQTQMDLFCSLIMDIPKNRLEHVLQKMAGLRGVDVEKL